MASLLSAYGVRDKQRVSSVFVSCVVVSFSLFFVFDISVFDVFYDDFFVGLVVVSFLLFFGTFFRKLGQVEYERPRNLGHVFEVDSYI